MGVSLVIERVLGAQGQNDGMCGVWIVGCVGLKKRSFGRAQAREPRFRFGLKPSPAVPAAEMERAASRRKSEGDVTTTVNLRQAGKFPASMRHQPAGSLVKEIGSEWWNIKDRIADLLRGILQISPRDTSAITEGLRSLWPQGHT